MRFKIFRTSSSWFYPEAPIDESKYNLEKIVDPKKNPNIERSNDEWHYEINITDIKQLLRISEDVGEIIVNAQADVPTIEIYDDYRE